MVQKIAAFTPSFPTKMEDFRGNGSQVWGTNSYATTYKEKAVFQPATVYCEACHTFKFDFKSKEGTR